jgi:uncharacterized protein (DUF885 family)
LKSAAHPHGDRHPPEPRRDRLYERDLFELAGETRQFDALKQAAVPVLAALRAYQEFLEKDLLPRANGDWRLGKERFARKLELELDTGLTADQVLKLANSEQVMVTLEMYVIARQLWSRWFPKTPLPADDLDGRHRTIEQVLHAIAQEHSTAETLTADVRETVAAVTQFITAADILRLPILIVRDHRNA